MAGNDEYRRDSAGADDRERLSETKQKVAPTQPETKEAPKPSSDQFEEETETGKLTGVGAW